MDCCKQIGIWLAFVLLTACSAVTEPTTQPTGENHGITGFARTGLPTLGDLKSTSTAYSDTWLGSEAFQHSANATTQGDSLVLTAGSNTVSWGIWEYNVGLRYLDQIEVVMDVHELEGEEEAYLAISNFAEDTWQFDGPLTIGKQLALDTAQHKSEEGLFYVAVIVTNGNMATVDRVILTTDDGWEFATIENNTLPDSLSVAIVEGRPAIALTINAIAARYYRANDALGLNWSGYRTIDNEGNIGNYCSLCVVSGNPAVAYYEKDAGDLLYARAEDSTGNAWGDPVIAAFGGDSGKYCSMVFADGAPNIAHYNDGNTYLAYAQAEDATGETWATAKLISNDGSTGKDASMAIINGVPAVSYRSDDTLWYSYAGNAGGTTWPNDLQVDSTVNTGAYSSLALIQGAPSIAYMQFGDGDLMYVRSRDAAGSDWFAPTTLDTTGNTGVYCSLAEIDGVPAIAYYNSTAEDLYFIQSKDSSGTFWYEPMVIDSDGNTGSHCRLIELDGQPAIAYGDHEESMTRWAIRQKP